MTTLDVEGKIFKNMIGNLYLRGNILAYKLIPLPVFEAVKFWARTVCVQSRPVASTKRTDCMT